MANDEDLARLRQGVGVWNNWLNRKHHAWGGLPWMNPSEADLSEADLSGADLGGANLREANLREANLSGAVLEEAILVRADLSRAILDHADLDDADLGGANLRQANLSGAHLNEANLRAADLGGANLRQANLSQAILVEAKLGGADLGGAILFGAHLGGAILKKAKLGGADLQSAILIQTDLANADLTGCRIYGISAWDLNLEGAAQRDLVITRPNEPEITVDNLEVAQFIYLLINNSKIRGVIDTITSKVVLILGRFTPERKAVLDALREELRKRDYLPVLFDFDKPASRDITETVSLLARMARFVIADITDARSIPQELMVIAPDLPSVPIQPLLQEGAEEYGMFEHFRRYPWVLKEHVYASPQKLTAELRERVIGPAEAKVREVRPRNGLVRGAKNETPTLGVSGHTTDQQPSAQPHARRSFWRRFFGK
jgi:uncharacterized protein YjbI with pentapeptide repeats